MSHVNQQLNRLSTFEGKWMLDPDRTTVEFRTKVMRFVTVKGSLKAIEGGASVGADGTISGSLIIDVASIDTNIKKRDAHLRSADFFEVDRHPTIIFTATAIRSMPSGQFEVAGTLTLHGQTRPITFMADVNPVSTEVNICVAVHIDRTEWGVGRSKVGLERAARVVVDAWFARN